jgi:hypothetical protein
MFARIYEHPAECNDATFNCDSGIDSLRSIVAKTQQSYQWKLQQSVAKSKHVRISRFSGNISSNYVGEKWRDVRRCCTIQTNRFSTKRQQWINRMWISSIDAISSRAEKFLNCFLHSLQLNSLSCRLVVVVVLGMTVFMTRLCKNSSLRGMSQIIILRNFFFSPLFLAQKFKVFSLYTK